MKPQVDVWLCLLDVYTKFQIDISKHVEKKSRSSINSPFGVFLSAEGQKLPNHDENQQRSRHSLYKCVYQIWGLYIIFEAMNAEKWLWPIFGCKVGQSVPIGMKLELDVWHCLLNVYTMFQNDISKHVEKKPGKLRKIQNAQK